MNYSFILLLFIGLLINSMKALRVECPQHCVCNEANNEELMQCQKGTSRLTIKVSGKVFESASIFESDEKGTQLTMTCTTFDQFVYEIGPKVNVSELISLEFNNCPLPVDGSLSLGFKNLNGIRFVSDNQVEYETFARRHFDGLSSLHELRLLSTESFSLADDAFASLSQLRTLYLHSNRINFKAFNLLPKLRKIEIGFLNGEFTLDELKSCKKLDQINLANLDIPRLSKRIFQNLPQSVETIFFYDNNITSIDSDVFESVSELWFVRFSGNVIRSFPSHFRVTSDNFKHFQLMGNHELIPDEMLSNLPELHNVDVHCNLKSVPENLFKGSYNLNIVNFTGNQLTDLPENLFANQTKLFHLYFDENRFDILPENLITNLMTKPQWVDSVSFIFSFKSNRIKTISERDWSLLLEKRAEYDFSNNLISDLSFFDNLSEKLWSYDGIFNFNGNPIVCDCKKIKTFQTFLKNFVGTLQTYYYYPTGLKCATPANLTGAAVRDVNCEV